ncbi:MAG TPA: metallophosphoesterase [archaeon]|nr:metallophosphoesterase [archaeon]
MFVKNEAAIKVGKYLVVADVHIGITKYLWQSGVSLPSQVKAMALRLNKLKKLTKTNELIILGDLKHKITGISMQERKEVPEFLRMLKFSKITVIKGNHDGFIEKLTKNIKKVSVKKSLVVGDYFFTHGHRIVKTKKKIIVVGHNHLCVKFQDDVDAVYNEPVWVRGKAGDNKIIIMPAFNDLCGYYAANKGKFNGPVASKLKGNAHVYLLDGTDIGRIRDLKVKE